MKNTIVVTCGRRGHQYAASAAAIRSGAWRRCPRCAPRSDGLRAEAL